MEKIENIKWYFNDNQCDWFTKLTGNYNYEYSREQGVTHGLSMTFKGVKGYVSFNYDVSGQYFSLGGDKPQSDSWDMKDNEDLVESIVEEFNKYMKPTNPLTVEEFNRKEKADKERKLSDKRLSEYNMNKIQTCRWCEKKFRFIKLDNDYIIYRQHFNVFCSLKCMKKFIPDLKV